jgi:hypothetical protein
LKYPLGSLTDTAVPLILRGYFLRSSMDTQIADNIESCNVFPCKNGQVVCILEKRMIHVQDRIEQDIVRIHYTS